MKIRLHCPAKLNLETNAACLKRCCSAHHPSRSPRERAIANSPALPAPGTDELAASAIGTSELFAQFLRRWRIHEAGRRPEIYLLRQVRWRSLPGNIPEIEKPAGRVVHAHLSCIALRQRRNPEPIFDQLQNRREISVLMGNEIRLRKWRDNDQGYSKSRVAEIADAVGRHGTKARIVGEKIHRPNVVRASNLDGRHMFIKAAEFVPGRNED